MKKTGRTIQIQSNVKKIPIGYQAEYWGTDSKQRNFRFWSVIAGTKIVNIYIESYNRSPDELEPIIRIFLKSLRI